MTEATATRVRRRPTPERIAQQAAESEAAGRAYAAEWHLDDLAERLVSDSRDMPVAKGPTPVSLADVIADEVDREEHRVRAAWDPVMGEEVLSRAIARARNDAEYHTTHAEGEYVAEMGTVEPGNIYVRYGEAYRGALAREKREATLKAKAYAQRLLAAPVDDLMAEWFWEGYHRAAADPYSERTAPSPALTAEIERLIAAWSEGA